MCHNVVQVWLFKARYSLAEQMAVTEWLEVQDLGMPLIIINIIDYWAEKFHE